MFISHINMFQKVRLIMSLILFSMFMTDLNVVQSHWNMSHMHLRLPEWSGAVVMHSFNAGRGRWISLNLRPAWYPSHHPTKHCSTWQDPRILNKTPPLNSQNLTVRESRIQVDSTKSNSHKGMEKEWWDLRSTVCCPWDARLI